MIGLVYFFYGLLAFSTVVTILIFKFGFQAQRPEDYAQTGPVFDIRERLNGKLYCEGIIFGPFGKVSSRFVAEFDAHWEGNIGVMTEVFHYDSGSVQEREWTLTLDESGKIKADAPDLVGSGYGQQSGSAVQLGYTIRLTEDAGGHALNSTDWMYLTENGVIMNRNQFRKFGIKVAEMVATIRPADMELKLAA